MTLYSLKPSLGTENDYFEASEVDDYSEADDYSTVEYNYSEVDDDYLDDDYPKAEYSEADDYSEVENYPKSEYDYSETDNYPKAEDDYSKEEDDYSSIVDFFEHTGLKNPDPSHFNEFDLSDLKPFEITPLKWKNSLEKVSSTSFEIGVPLSILNRMRDYCDSRGITQLFRNLMSDPMDVDTDKVLNLNGTLWYIQRPSKKWESNSHWLEPADEVAEKDYQNMLFQDDFYRFLDSIGNFLGLDGIYVNNLTFMAVSYCDKNTFPHMDFSDSKGKAFVFIFHLEEAKNADPELLVFSEYGSRKGGWYKYNKNRAIMLGDKSYHATAPCDYRDTGEMRLSATVYFFDVNEDNVDGILEDFDQFYPPGEIDRDYLLERSGIHWTKPDHDEI